VIYRKVIASLIRAFNLFLKLRRYQYLIWNIVLSVKLLISASGVIHGAGLWEILMKTLCTIYMCWNISIYKHWSKTEMKSATYHPYHHNHMPRRIWKWLSDLQEHYEMIELGLTTEIPNSNTLQWLSLRPTV